MTEQRVDTMMEGSPACARTPLVDAITMFLQREHSPLTREMRHTLEEAIDVAGPEAIGSLSSRLAHAGADWTYYPRDPLARSIHHALADGVLRHPPALVGREHLSIVAGQPVVIFANHLSYSDANVLDVVFQRCGAQELANRLTVVAGPKVYSDLKRRFSSLCFGTIKVPQSSGLSTGEAAMDARSVARAARQSIEVAYERLRLGEALLVFPEGTRSRTSEMQTLLPGVARYLDGPDAWILPVGLTGSEGLFPIGEDSLNPVRIVVGLSRPIQVSRLQARVHGDRRLLMDVVGLAIADALPPAYRGAYAHDAPNLEEARALLHEMAS